MPALPPAGGVLNIAKPSGPTSHDVVNRVRRILGIRRVGHSGTLDPLAEGVLLAGVGASTRLLEYLNDLPKRYHAGVRLGETTDTQDLTGTVVVRKDATRLTATQVEATLAHFRGEIEQVPPMYSAVKVAGEPLYNRARRGEVVERPARRVTIYEIAMHNFRPGPAAEAALEVVCSSGTYVRTLCHDLGERLGTGAAMSGLTRTAIGQFTLDRAVTLDELARLADAGEPLPWIPPERAVEHLPALCVDAECAAALRHGKRVALSSAPAAPLLRVLDADGHLVAIARSIACKCAAPEGTDCNLDFASEHPTPNTQHPTPNTECRTPITAWIAPEKVFPSSDADP